MDMSTIQELLFSNLEEVIRNHKSLDIFISNRSKFEGWLKVEVIEILVNHGCSNVLPEKDRIDVTFDDWALELKTCNTNYRYDGVVNKIRPITLNIQQILDDINNLRTTDYAHKAIFFVAFPLEHEKIEWREQLEKITSVVKHMGHKQIYSGKGIPLVMYMAEI